MGGWTVPCGHYDAFDDPAHDCATWGDADDTTSEEGGDL